MFGGCGAGLGDAGELVTRDGMSKHGLDAGGAKLAIGYDVQ